MGLSEPPGPFTLPLVDKSQAVIRPTRMEDAASLCAAIRSVAAEQWFLATVDGFSLSETRAYLQVAIEASFPHLVAVGDTGVVGSCDIRPHPGKGFTHVGRLGMFVLARYRGGGVGRRLLTAALQSAKTSGLEKVELEVFADNLAAIHLYETHGFFREGVRQRTRKWRDRYQDLLLMGRWLGADSPV